LRAKEFKQFKQFNDFPIREKKLEREGSMRIREDRKRLDVGTAVLALQDIRAALQSEQCALEAVKANAHEAQPIIVNIARLEREKLHATKALLEAQEAAELRAVRRAREEWTLHLEELRATRERLKEFAGVG
jgi:hypothetical protein